MISRRRLLELALGSASLVATSKVVAKDSTSKTLLILGGTGFIGPYLTDMALKRGWKVTHFNRGKRNPDGVAGEIGRAHV